MEASPDSFFTTNVVKKPTMSRTYCSPSKQLVVALALAFGASGVALTDDSGMNAVTGDSHACFHCGQNLGNVARAPSVQAAAASAGRIKKEDELTPDQKIRLARAELTITLLRLFSDGGNPRYTGTPFWYAPKR
jgi:hypothetical protein